MKNLPLAGFRSFLAFIFLLSLILGCRKDSLTLTEDFPQINGPKVSEKNFPISVTEARAYFERLDSYPSSSFGDGTSYSFLKTIEPDWDLAFIGHSQSGKEIVTTPLADSSLSALNQGRAGAKLIFSKTTEDSISVNILIFLADTAYYQGNAGVLNFNTFTGLYLLFDIGQHFEAGLNVIAGSPVGRVKAINQMGSQNSPEYREDAEDEDCPRTFESMLIPCDVVFACIDGFQLITVESADCTDAVWPTGGGGSGGGGSGGGSGGTGTGAPNFWGIFYTNMPVEIFLQNGGTLPPGLDITRAKHLLEIDQVYHLSQTNLHWLADNTLILDAIYGYFINHPTPTGDDLNAISRLIALIQNYNLNEFQQLYLAYHLNLVNDISQFLSAHPNSSTSLDIVSTVIQYNLDFVTVDDLELLFEHSTIYNNYKQYLQQNPNITQEEKKTILRMVALAPNNPIDNLSNKLNCFDITSNSNFTHRVSIYVDQPVANSDASASSKDLAGHTWITLEQDQGGGNIVTLSVGLYPNDFATPCYQIDGGAYNDDGGHKFDVSVTWQITDYGFNNLVQDLKSQPYAPLYDLSDYNCSTWAVEKLNHLGFNIPATDVVSLNAPGACHVEGLTPGQLGQDLRNDYQLPDEATRNSTGGAAPNSSCQ